MIHGWKSLDYDAFRNAIQDFRLSSELSLHEAAYLDDLFDLYSSTMTHLINKILPLCKISTWQKPIAVWFDADRRQQRHRTRLAERCYCRSHDPTDRYKWIAQLRSLHRLYNQKESNYWENLVSHNKDNPKRLWSSISGHLRRISRSPSHPTFSAEDFLQMQMQKIDNLHASTADAPLPQCSCTKFKLENFQPITETELYRVIKSSNLKSSELDPLPPFILINVLDDLTPFLVYLINRSLVEGHLPVSQK